MRHNHLCSSGESSPTSRLHMFMCGRACRTYLDVCQSECYGKASPWKGVRQKIRDYPDSWCVFFIIKFNGWVKVQFNICWIMELTNRKTQTRQQHKVLLIAVHLAVLASSGVHMGADHTPYICSPLLRENAVGLTFDQSKYPCLNSHWVQFEIWTLLTIGLNVNYV